MENKMKFYLVTTLEIYYSTQHTLFALVLQLQKKRDNRLVLYLLMFVIFYLMSKYQSSKKKKIQEFEPATIQKQCKSFIEQWQQNIKRELSRWKERKPQTLVPRNFREIHLTYLHFLNQYMNDDRFNLDSEYSRHLEKTLKEQQNLKSFMLSEGFLVLNRENRLNVSINNNGMSYLKKLQAPIIMELLILMRALSLGFININNAEKLVLRNIGRSAHNEIKYYAYDCQTEEGCFILSIGMERIPYFGSNRKQIEYFQLKLCIQVEAFSKDTKYFDEQLKKLDTYYEQNLRFTFDHSKYSIAQTKIPQNVEYFNHREKNNQSTRLRRYQIQPYKRLEVKLLQSLDYFFNLTKNQIQTSHNLPNQNEEENEDENEEDNEDNKYYTLNYQDLESYVKQIISIPNFKFKLSKQQKQAIKQQGSAIVIGRSGTGKTLLSIIRLYSIEYLTRKEMIQNKLSATNRKIRCPNYYLDQALPFRNAFLTASPYLIEEIYSQYQDMNVQIQADHKTKCQVCQLHLKLPNQLGQNDNIDELLLKIEKRENVDYPMSALNKKSFPLFLTIRSLIIMIDCGLKRPFFNIKQSKKLENKKKIVWIYWQKYYRFCQFYQDKLHIAFRHKLSQYSKIQKNILKQQNAKFQALEVNYEIFERLAWAQISQPYYKFKNVEKLNPAVVWIEIFSVIKGSAKAHITHLKCLSPSDYLSESKNNLLSLEQKIDVYHLFQEYQMWKIVNSAFDQMDVINHILEEIMLKNYKDILLDYTFIDEVQDLPPATIYLITKMTRKDIFYCGDTAQAISKGVSFKFSQIKTLYTPKYFKHYIQKEINKHESVLTVNFRSHNRILMLANFLVEMLQQLFPNMIDVLEKQQSDFFGPNSILINKQDQSIIYDLFLGPQKQQVLKNQNQDPLMNRYFSSEQVVLVRNLEQKDKLPKFLQKELVLTCEEVKGLEFNDIVIYNFFGSSTCKKKWELLDYLDTHQLLLQAKQFESRIHRRNIEEGNQVNNYLEFTEEEKDNMGYDFKIYKYRVKQLKRSLDYKKIDLKNYYEVSNELKKFYTLVTRAKNIVVIFDNDMPRHIFHFLTSLNLVKVIDHKQVLKCHKQLVKYSDVQSRNYVRFVDKQNRWNEQGLKMLTRKNYVEAEKCFEKSGNVNGVYRTRAMKLVDQCQIRLIQFENQLANPKRYTKQEFKLKTAIVQKQMKIVLENLSIAAEYYKKINLVRKAADLYKKSENYQKAKDCYLELQKYQEAAECWQKLKEYQQALKLYESLKKIDKVFNCLIKLKKWRQAYRLIVEHKDLVKQTLQENDSQTDQIKICFTQIIKSEMNIQQNYKSLIMMNSGYDTQQKQRKERIFKQQILDKSSKIAQTNLNSMYNKQNLIFLNNIAQQLMPIYQEYILLKKIYQNANQQLSQITIRKQEIQKQLDLCIVKQTKQSCEVRFEDMFMSIEQYEDQQENYMSNRRNFRSKYLHNVWHHRKQKQRLKNQLQYISSQYQQIKEQEQQANSRLQQFTQFHEGQKIKSSIKNTIQLGSQLIKSFQMDNQTKKKIKNKISYRPFHVSESYFNIYKSYLFDYTILEILGQLQGILLQVSNFMQPRKSNQIAGYHHLQILNNIQYELCYRDDEMGNILKMYKLFEKLDCFEACYLMSDYYFLPYHFHRTILNQIGLKSKNLYENRKVKEVINADKQQKSNQLQVSSNQNLLNKIGMNLFECCYLKKMTSQYLQQEYVLKDLIYALILLGFHQNVLSFLNQEECFRISYLYMDYQKIIGISVQKAKKLGMKLKENTYYCFLEIAKNRDYQYLNLTNIFSMQKIFYDFDGCQRIPILSKPLDIDDLELDEKEIVFCNSLVQQRNDYYQFARIPTLKAQIQRIQTQISQRQRQTQVQIQTLRSEKIYFINEIYQKKEFTENLRKQIAQYHQTVQEQKKKLKDDKHLLSAIQKGKKLLQRDRKYIQYSQRQMQRLQFQYKDILEQEEQVYNEIRDRQKVIKKIQTTEAQKIREDSQIEAKIQQLESEINNLNVKITKLQKQMESQKVLGLQAIKERQDLIEKCRDKNSSKQREQQIIKEIILQQKQKKVKKKNQERRQQILSNIQKSSNLQDRNQQQYKLLHQFVKKIVKIQNLQKNANIKNMLLKVLKNAQNKENKGFETLTDNQLCILIIVYLQFLFNKQFQEVCVRLCQINLKQNQKKMNQYIEELNQRNTLYTQHQFYNKKIQFLEKKLNQNLRQYQRRQVVRQIQQLKEKNQRIFINIQEIDDQFKIRGLDEIFQEYQMIFNLFKIIDTFKKVNKKNLRFIELFLGFFQCRLIKNCRTLSILEGDYVFVDSNSILLKSMKAKNMESFSYYFDCSNKVILTHFSHAYNAILTYLQNQYKKIYPELLYLFNVQKKQYLNNILGKKAMVEKNIFLSKPISNDGKVFEASYLVTKRNDLRAQLKKVYQQFSNGQILTKIRNLKQEVLQFYLSKKRREGETLHFTLFQLKQYTCLQNIVVGMPMFNSKLLREVKAKMKQLESAKNSWITKEHVEYEQELKNRKN